MDDQEKKIIGTASITTAPANAAANALNASNIQITWDEVAGAAGYHVFRSTTENGTYVQVGDITATSFLDTGLAPNTTYYYRITAYDADGDGPLSAVTSATTAAALDAPQNLTAIAVGPTRIDTSWDAVAGAARYNVYRSTTATGPYELVGLTTVPSYADVGLAPNTTYYYRVAAAAGNTEGPLSNIAAATTDADIPAPANVVATPVSQTQINTTWDAVPNAIAYVVYRSTTPDGTYQYVGTTTEPAFSDTGLTPNTTYYYRVAAVVGGVEGSPSAYAAATTFPAVPVPPAPANVHAQALSCTEILVAWDASAGAEGYNVYRSTSPDGPYQLVGTTAAPDFIDTGLSPSTTYYYIIQAYEGGQFSQQSTPASATTPPCGTPVPPCQPCCCPHCGCNPCCCPCEPQCTPHCQ